MSLAWSDYYVNVLCDHSLVDIQVDLVNVSSIEYACASESEDQARTAQLHP